MQKTNREINITDRMYHMLLGTAALIGIFAFIAQPDISIFSGLWRIQISEAGLITDPSTVGGPGAALLNAALVLLTCTVIVRGLKLPFTGMSFACLYMLTGFALLGENLLNSAPIIFGGWLFTKYNHEDFGRYVYLSMYSTCLSPLVSFLFNHISGWYRWPLAMAVGILVGFLMPTVAEFTVRIHQGYTLYNVGFAAGFVGLAAASIMKGFGVHFTIKNSWSTAGSGVMLACVVVLLLGLFIIGVQMGCRSIKTYRRILRHSGRAVADFGILDGPAVTFVNMALVGGIGLTYLLLLYPKGVRLNGPLVCCILSMTGFAAFGKHPRNVIPVMAGAVLAAIIMTKVPITAPSVLLATLFCTSLAPISGQYGWYWGVIAGFLHMTIVQNTSLLHGGMNLYNNGFSAGLVCIILIPIIEAVKPIPKE